MNSTNKEKIFMIFNLNIFKNQIVVIFLIFVFFEPDFIKYIPIVHDTFSYIRVFLATWVFLYYIINKKSISLISILIIIFYFILFLTSIYKNGAIFNLLSISIPIIGFILFLEALIDRDMTLTLKYLNIAFSLIVYLNLFFLIVYPEGIINHYFTTSNSATKHFLGNRNQFASILFPAIAVSVLYSHYYYNKLNNQTKLLILSVAITLIKVWSATALMGLFLIIIYLIFFYKKERQKFITAKRLSVFYILIFFGIIVFRQQEMFSFLIEDILGKDLSFSTRTDIWDRTFDMIRHSFLFGYGQIEGSRYIVYSAFKQRDAHNIFLQICLKGGLVSLLLFISIITRTVFKLDSEKNDLSIILSFFIFTMFIVMLMEVFSLTSTFMLLLIAINISKLNYDSMNYDIFNKKIMF